MKLLFLSVSIIMLTSFFPANKNTTSRKTDPPTIVLPDGKKITGSLRKLNARVQKQGKALKAGYCYDWGLEALPTNTEVSHWAFHMCGQTTWTHIYLNPGQTWRGCVDYESTVYASGGQAYEYIYSESCQ